MRLLNGNIQPNDGGITTLATCGDNSGEEYFSFDLPMGYSVTAELETNNSTSVRMYDGSGQVVLFWNSGTYIACSILGAGVGLMVGSYTANPAIGNLARSMTTFGCSQVVNRTMEDGDAFTC